MTEKIKAILKEIITDNGLDYLGVKRIVPSNLEIAGTKMVYGTPHSIYYYKIKKLNKTIYFEFDEYREIAREVSIF